MQNSNVKLVVDANTTNHPPVLDDTFFNLAKKTDKVTGEFKAHMVKLKATVATFTSPRSGGSMTPEQWSDAKRDTILAFGTKRQIQFGLMCNADWQAHVKTVGTERAAADKAERDAAGKLHNNKFSDWKKLAKANDERVEAGRAKGQQKPLQERVHIGASKLLATINTNNAKAEPDHLKESVKVKALIAELIQLTK